MHVNKELEREREVSLKRSRLGGVETFRYPLLTSQAYSLFGLSLGLFPTLAIAIRLLADVQTVSPSFSLISALFVLAAAITGVMGYFLGKRVEKYARIFFEWRALPAIVLLTLLGAAWGALSGLAGGVFFFVFGAIPGAIIGTVVGGVSLPVFAVLTRLLERDSHVDLRHFAPIAAGITLSICGYILSL
ncbi:MAG TPA: hypothetical protein PKD24_12895 [Pyrinomonadaceae bacterium]|nr:hypothetical protein [Pyrinomonadaceae bacterium]HMP65622.1 hypothetical protein [Pyrinomonadaceae bacterium]